MANIEGHGAPRWTLEGNIGDKYTDLNNMISYECVGIYTISTMKPGVIETIYEWKPIVNKNTGSGGTATITKESIQEALGYIPPNYDMIRKEIDDKLGVVENGTY